MNKNKLLAVLEAEDRNAVWLSKRLQCSHTLVYNWLKGITPISDTFQIKIRGIFGSKYGI